MVKEANDSTKPKTPKQQRGSTTQYEDRQKNITPKRNAAERSLLEGKPGKKQKDGTCNLPNQGTDEIKEKRNNDSSIDLSRDITQDCPKENQGSTEDAHEQSIGQDLNLTLQSLLEELRDIKSSILDLDAKLDRELNTKATDHKELTETVTAQQTKLIALDRANKELQEQNRTLQSDLLNAQKDLLLT